MNCDHKRTLTYNLTRADKSDFCRRLEDFLILEESSKGVNFLTPTSIRGNRAKSMLATTKGSMSTGGTTISKLIENDTDAEYPSCEKRRSSCRRRNGVLMAPKQFSNCELCGSIYFNVSFR